MNYNSLTSVVLRVFAFGTAATIALGVIEYTANVFGYTVLRQWHTPGRLIEFGAMLAVIVIALLLRQIRDELRKRQP
jgi:hypothetical protein